MSHADYTTILFAEQGPVARITLNRPDKRNPIGPLTCGELVDAFSRAKNNNDVRVIVLTGAGKVFSAGGDLGQMAGGQAPSGGIEPASLVTLFTTMHQLGKPTVAMINGHALAGGMGLMVACDLVVASDTATFGLTETKVGLWPMMITAEIVRSIGRKKTLELMLTGQRIDADEALRVGLINRVVPAAELEQQTAELCDAIADKSPTALSLGLLAFYETQDMPHKAALEHLEKQLFAVLATEDAREGITAFLQKRAPIWKGK